MKYLKKFQSHSQYESYIATDYAKPNVSYCVAEGDVHYNPWVETRVVAKLNVTDTSSATKILNQAARTSFTEIEIDGIVQPSVVSGYTFDTLGEHTVKYTLKNATTISSIAFHSCYNITSISIPNTVTSIGDSAFQNCSGLTSVMIPNSLTNIGSFTFADCSGLVQISIPDSVTNMGEGTFRNCSSLKRLNSNTDGVFILPNGITSIGNTTFYRCTNLTNITIPNSVTSIGQYAFEWCSELTSITSLAMIAPTIDSITFENVKTEGTLYVPQGSTGYDTWMGTGDYYLGKYGWTKVEQ